MTKLLSLMAAAALALAVVIGFQGMAIAGDNVVNVSCDRVDGATLNATASISVPIGVSAPDDCSTDGSNTCAQCLSAVIDELNCKFGGENTPNPSFGIDANNEETAAYTLTNCD